MSFILLLSDITPVQIGLITEEAPNLSADRARTVLYPTVFREGPFRSTA
jgi:hypothetical protein